MELDTWEQELEDATDDQDANYNQDIHYDLWKRDIFSYYTTQRIPPILHASVESRAEGLKYYELSYSNAWQWPEGVQLAPRSLPTIYYNKLQDRICPMGYIPREAQDKMWSELQQPKSCAINLAREEDYDASYTSLPQTAGVLFGSLAQPDELLLYYSRESTPDVGHSKFRALGNKNKRKNPYSSEEMTVLKRAKEFLEYQWDVGIPEIRKDEREEWKLAKAAGEWVTEKSLYDDEFPFEIKFVSLERQ